MEPPERAIVPTSPGPGPAASILLTGATGHVGGALLRHLERAGVPVRCLARRPGLLAGSVAPGTEVVGGDAVSGEGLADALRGIETAYYLVHSMASSGDFEEWDRRAARRFGVAARAAGVRRIVYLGGLADPSARLSPHLRSRIEVGRLLAASGVPVLEFRASIVIGAGSLSFEMVRALTERLPILIAPRWVETVAQPIALSDLLEYLDAARGREVRGHEVVEIGGADRVSYGDLMREMARQRGLRRYFVRVPVLTPRLSSLWLALVTPLQARVGRTLIDSIREPTVVRDPRPAKEFGIRPLHVREAIARALAEEGAARGLPGKAPAALRIDRREAAVAASPELTFRVVEGIGGEEGFYANRGLWAIRGLLDRILGGPGMRRLRSDPGPLSPGDVLACWRVEDIEPPRRLRLRAEMRLPGEAWLEFEVRPAGAGSRLRQTASFEARGARGRLYWAAMLPLHAVVFGGMLRAMVRRAEALPAAPSAEEGDRSLAPR